MSLSAFSALSGLAVLAVIVDSFGITMSPNLSLTQSAQSVRQVLTASENVAFPAQADAIKWVNFTYLSAPIS